MSIATITRLRHNCITIMAIGKIIVYTNTQGWKDKPAIKAGLVDKISSSAAVCQRDVQRRCSCCCWSSEACASPVSYQTRSLVCHLVEEKLFAAVSFALAKSGSVMARTRR